MGKEATIILENIKGLSLTERLDIIELILKEIKSAVKEEVNRQKAAGILLNDYLNDDELTAFKALDGEDFYEAN